MQCSQCGAMVRPGSKICSTCGARLDAKSEYEGAAGAGLSAYGGDDGSYDVDPQGPYRPQDENPGQGRNRARGSERGYGHNSQQGKPDPLADPRAPRFLKESVPPTPRASRREASARDDRRAEPGRGGRQWDDQPARDKLPVEAMDLYDSHDRQDDYRDSTGRSSPPMPGRRVGSYQSGYEDSPSAEYSAEYPDPRGYNQRNVSYDRRRQQPQTRGERRSRSDAYDGSGYGGNRDHTDGYGQSGRRDRAGRRSRISQENPVLRLQPPARARRAGSTTSSTARNPSTGRRLAIFAVVAIILTVSVVTVAALRDTSLLSRIRGESGISDNAPPFVAYTPGPTPAPPASYKEFDSPHSLYVLDYPQSWSTSSSTTGAGGNYDNVDELTRSSPLASFIVEEASAFSPITRSDIIQAEVQGAKGTGRTFTEISNPITTVEIAGEQWLRSDYLVTENDGTKFHMAILTCHHNQRGYAIVLLALPNTFSQDTATAFEPILHSFHFTG
jgi:hypothetical protein